MCHIKVHLVNLSYQNTAIVTAGLNCIRFSVYLLVMKHVQAFQGLSLSKTAGVVSRRRKIRKDYTVKRDRREAHG